MICLGKFSPIESRANAKKGKGQGNDGAGAEIQTLSLQVHCVESLVCSVL